MSNARSGTRLLLCAFGLCLSARAQYLRTTAPMPEDGEVLSAALADLDGDRVDDLVVGLARPQKERPRALLVFLAGPGGGPPVLAKERGFELPPDVVGVATADVHPDPGEEILLFSATGVFALRSAGTARDRVSKLASIDLLWQFPGPRDLLDLGELVDDVDRDGLADLVIPEPGGYRVLRQTKGADDRRELTLLARLEIPPGAEPAEAEEAGGAFKVSSSGGSRRIEVRLPFPTEGQIPEMFPFLEVQDRVPSPHLLDLDGDGDREIVAQTSTSLLTWSNDAGRFATLPTATWPLPVPAGRDRRLDLSYGAHAADLDLDGKSDAIVFAGDKNAKEIRTQILVFTQAATDRRRPKTPDAPLFGPEGIPDDLLVVAGFAGAPSLADVDLDGRPDLAVVVVRPELLDSLRAKADARVDAELHVWRNEGGRFTRTPAATLGIAIPADGLRGGGRRLAARFLDDVDGDGARELLLRSEPDRLRIVALRRRGRGALAFDEKARFETAIDAEARLVVRPARGGAPEVILVIEDTQVHVVRAAP